MDDTIILHKFVTSLIRKLVVILVGKQVGSQLLKLIREDTANIIPYFFWLLGIFVFHGNKFLGIKVFIF
ncbi:hypothetical protein DXB58_05700 [Bacteroides sp. OM05-10AA]|nr:hypothetical protein DXB58_05700 [Bacteroides sp. OM05-10AA]RGQ67509.1 hypothetical protein DWY87_07340 [Bacteroides sp. AF27-33]